MVAHGAEPEREDIESFLEYLSLRQDGVGAVARIKLEAMKKSMPSESRWSGKDESLPD